MDHHNFLNTLMAYLAPDFFNEDPKMFLGDHDGYFKIVKKRSIVFYYISRIMLYSLIIFIIYNFLNKNAQENEVQVTRNLYNENKRNTFIFFQMASLTVIIIGSISIFVMVTEPKQILDDAGSNLIFEFRNINVTSHEIVDDINKINEMKISIPIDQQAVFSINNII